MRALASPRIPTVVDAELFKLRVPVGRTIGDNSCYYNVFDLVAVSLKSHGGQISWGYGIAISEGHFTRSGWWIQPMPGEDEMLAELLSLIPQINRTPTDWISSRRFVTTKFMPLEMAIEQAIWDLCAKDLGLPMWRLLANLTGNDTLARQTTPPRVPAYASLLDYPLTDEETVSLLRVCLAMGFRTIKVKLGAPDPHRDLHRLLLVAKEAGPDVTLQADANEAWDAETCISRLKMFHAAGISLHYIEDPLSRTNLAGFLGLRGKIPFSVAGHDYFNTFEQYQEFVEAGAFDNIRAGQNLRIQVLLSEFCRERSLPIYYGNSVGEQNVHAAAALPGTARLEYSHTNWNTLFETPVLIEAGCVIPREVSGLGLTPRREMIERFRQTEASAPRSFNPDVT